MKSIYTKFIESGWACSLLLALTAAVYVAATQADFVLDDFFLIKQNRLLKQDLWALLSGDLWAGEPHPTTKSTFYRPIFLGE